MARSGADFVASWPRRGPVVARESYGKICRGRASFVVTKQSFVCQGSAVQGSLQVPRRSFLVTWSPPARWPGSARSLPASGVSKPIRCTPCPWPSRRPCDLCSSGPATSNFEPPGQILRIGKSFSEQHQNPPLKLWGVVQELGFGPGFAPFWLEQSEQTWRYAGGAVLQLRVDPPRQD